jgi:hypothetical protein
MGAGVIMEMPPAGRRASNDVGFGFAVVFLSSSSSSLGFPVVFPVDEGFSVSSSSLDLFVLVGSSSPPDVRVGVLELSGCADSDSLSGSEMLLERFQQHRPVWDILSCLA